MLKRLIEITKNGQYLKCKFGLLEVYDVTKNIAEKKGDCPLDDLLALIVMAQRVQYDNDLITSLGDKGIPVVFCGDKFIPKSILFPLDCNFEQARRMDAQINASKPLKKRIWADIVRKKIQTQSEVLELLNKRHERLDRLSNSVYSGDPDNKEAQAAAYYFKQLFGKNFVRDREKEGINQLLNYGYTILRTATLRCLLSAGLHPSLGVFHRSYTNTFRLADDLMEPFRPLIDLKVLEILKEYEIKKELDSELKKKLASVVYLDIATDQGRSTLLNCIQDYATSMALIYLNTEDSLKVPKKIIPMTYLK